MVKTGSVVSAFAAGGKAVVSGVEMMWDQQKLNAILDEQAEVEDARDGESVFTYVSRRAKEMWDNMTDSEQAQAIARAEDEDEETDLLITV